MEEIFKSAIQLKDAIKDLRELRDMYLSLSQGDKLIYTCSPEVDKIEYQMDCLQSDLQSHMEFIGQYNEEV